MIERTTTVQTGIPFVLMPIYSFGHISGKWGNAHVTVYVLFEYIAEQGG